MKAVRNYRWKRGLLILGLAISLALIGIFTIRTVHNIPHARVDEPIRPWMNVPYIAHSYHVAARILYQALGLAATSPFDRRPLSEIGRDQHRPVQTLISLLEGVIHEVRTGTLTPPAPTPGPARSTP